MGPVPGTMLPCWRTNSQVARIVAVNGSTRRLPDVLAPVINVRSGAEGDKQPKETNNRRRQTTEKGTKTTCCCVSQEEGTTVTRPAKAVCETCTFYITRRGARILVSSQNTLIAGCRTM